MTDDNEPKAADEWGLGSVTWMLRVALRALDYRALLYGLDNMLAYVYAHQAHLENEVEDCDGPDIWEALDVLIQTAASGTYTVTYDPQDGPPPKPEPKMDEADIDDLVNRFRAQMDGIFPDEKEGDDGDKDTTDSAGGQ